MSLMVILSMGDSVSESASLTTKSWKPKIEWVDTADHWENNGGALVCFQTVTPVRVEDPYREKVAEFASGEWVGVKRYSRDEAMADEIMNDPRVKEILAEKLVREIKPGKVYKV